MPVSSWWARDRANPLRSREALWGRVFELLSTTGRTHEAVLEFVPADDPGRVAAEASTLRGWLSP